METEFRVLNTDEVISLDSKSQKFAKTLKTFTVQEAITALKDTIMGSQYELWLDEGVICKVLTPGNNWKTGKVKLSLIFCPEEADPNGLTAASEVGEETIEYPLDEIRHTLNSDETP